VLEQQERKHMQACTSFGTHANLRKYNPNSKRVGILRHTLKTEYEKKNKWY